MAENSPSRRYSPATIHALAALSEGRCYFPGCSTPIIVFIGKAPRINAQIAHICALNERGPRYRPELSVPQRNAFSNLILLCMPHHTEVDRNWNSYPPELLQKWKRQRETDGIDALAGLSGLTEGRLEEMVGQALAARDKQIEQAIKKLEQIDSSAARWLDEMRTEITSIRRQPLIDESIVNALARAARDLRVLDESVVVALGHAADSLRHLPDSVRALERAARQANNLREY